MFQICGYNTILMILSVSFKLKTKRDVTRVTRTTRSMRAFTRKLLAIQGRKVKLQRKQAQCHSSCHCASFHRDRSSSTPRHGDTMVAESKFTAQSHTHKTSVFCSRSAQLSRRLQKNIERQIDRATGHSTGNCCDATVKQYYGGSRQRIAASI